MKLLTAVMEAEEWLSLKELPAYRIIGAEETANGGFNILVTQAYGKPFHLIITSEGKIINDNGGDCVAIEKSAMIGDPYFSGAIAAFEKKWYPPNS